MITIGFYAISISNESGSRSIFTPSGGDFFPGLDARRTTQEIRFQIFIQSSEFWTDWSDEASFRDSRLLWKKGVGAGRKAEGK